MCTSFPPATGQYGNGVTSGTEEFSIVHVHPNCFRKAHNGQIRKTKYVPQTKHYSLKEFNYQGTQFEKTTLLGHQESSIDQTTRERVRACSI